MKKYDAIVVGSGPNGLAAAITMAQAKLSVLLIEAKKTVGGGMRSAELTLPGFTHDVCSAVHPLGYASPFFSSLPLNEHGLKWVHPTYPVAHPFQDGSSAILDRSVDNTCAFLGNDGSAYKQLMEPLVTIWNQIGSELLGPLNFEHPVSMAKFGYYGLQSAQQLANRTFKGKEARGLFAGLAAHAILPLNKYLTAAYGLILGILGHTVGWPIPSGGSQQLANALASYFKSLGGEILLDTVVTRMDQLPPSRFIFFDVTPKQLLNIVGDKFPYFYKKRLESYRYGPGVFKMDWALSKPIPWKDKKCLSAGTLHLGGTFEEIAESEQKVWDEKIPNSSFILLSQPSLFDPSRAPDGKHVAWAYCHVPNGSTVDLTKKMEMQIEQYAPGFKECILQRNAMTAMDLEKYNPNYIGGDITGGVQDIFQFFTRPVARLNPYSTPIEGVYICSASTPPGGGVHGMCGYHAAKSALRKLE